MNLIELKEDEMRGAKPKIKVPENFGLAGGCVRRWFTGEPQNSDYDFYRLDGKEDFELDIKGVYKDGQTIVADNYKKGDRLIQVIKRPYESIEKLFEVFDFHHCQFAYSDGKIYSTKKGIICALRKHLSFNNIQEEFELDTLRRAFKYQRQGFTPCSGTIAKLAKALRESQSDFDEQLMMSPKGGTHSIIPFD